MELNRDRHTMRVTTAAFQGLVHFREALERLQHTHFYTSADLLQQLLDEDDSSGLRDRTNA
jgi:hypothetical protein